MRENHLFVRCPTCSGTGLVPLDETARRCLARGLAAGTCGDWFECADCQATGKVEIVERITTPTAHSVVIDGNRKVSVYDR